jgi:hypothetical protein
MSACELNMRTMREVGDENFIESIERLWEILIHMVELNI